MTHKEIIKMVAESVGSSYVLAEGLIQTFIDIVNSRIDAEDEIKIRSIGTFKWVAVQPKKMPNAQLPAGKKLKFTPATQFRTRRYDMPKDEGMDKYAVVTEDIDDAKTAGVERICPICGETLDSGGACPEHGTEPFEPISG